MHTPFHLLTATPSDAWEDEGTCNESEKMKIVVIAPTIQVKAYVPG